MVSDNGLPVDYMFLQEKYNLQGYDYMRIKLCAVCPNYKCHKDITHVIEANMTSTFCPYCGTKIRLYDEPQLLFSIEVELHEFNGNWIASHDSVRIW